MRIEITDKNKGKRRRETKRKLAARRAITVRRAWVRADGGCCIVRSAELREISKKTTPKIPAAGSHSWGSARLRASLYLGGETWREWRMANSELYILSESLYLPAGARPWEGVGGRGVRASEGEGRGRGVARNRVAGMPASGGIRDQHPCPQLYHPM